MSVIFFWFCQTKIFAAAINEYDLDTYTSHAVKEFSFRFFSNAFMEKINFAANLFFSFAKYFVLMVDKAITLLFDANVIEKYATQFSVYTYALWNTLYPKFGVIIFSLSVLIIFLSFLFQNSQKAIRKGLILLVVFGIGYGFSKYSDRYIKIVNNLSRELQGVVITAIYSGETQANSINTVRNMYFDLAIITPYNLMNYGTSDETEINKTDANRSKSLLRKEVTEETFEEIENYIKTNEKDNEFVKLNKVDYKLIVGFVN